MCELPGVADHVADMFSVFSNHKHLILRFQLLLA